LCQENDQPFQGFCIQGDQLDHGQSGFLGRYKCYGRNSDDICKQLESQWDAMWHGISLWPMLLENGFREYFKTGKIQRSPELYGEIVCLYMQWAIQMFG